MAGNDEKKGEELQGSERQGVVHKVFITTLAATQLGSGVYPCVRECEPQPRHHIHSEMPDYGKVPANRGQGSRWFSMTATSTATSASEIALADLEKMFLYINKRYG
jgi:hypothetical protein